MTWTTAPIRRFAQRVGSTTRTVVLLIVLVAAGFVLTAHFTVERTEQQLSEQVDERLIEDAQAVSSALRDDENDVARIGRALGGRQALIVVSATGSVLAAAPSGDVDDPDRLPPLPPVERLATRLGRPFDVGGDGRPEYRVGVAALPDDRYVVVASPLAPTQAILDDLGSSLQVVGAATQMILGVFIWVVVRAANRQIDQMIGIAERVGAGDLSVRTGATSGATEAVRLAHALDTMTSQLREAAEARDHADARLRRFVADASHELRTPLATIRGYAQLHRAGALADPADSERAMDRIESETGRMAHLVEEMLLLARLDQGRPLRSDSVDLGGIVVDSVSDARAREGRRRICLLLPPGPAFVDGDEQRLRQVVENLLENTRVHTPADATVSVSLSADGDTVELVVADDGPGMHPDDAARAFDRFYRAETARPRNDGGTGLGLAIVDGIVAAHSGTVGLATRPGQGTTVTVRLPRAAP